LSRCNKKLQNYVLTYTESHTSATFQDHPRIGGLRYLAIITAICPLVGHDITNNHFSGSHGGRSLQLVAIFSIHRQPCNRQNWPEQIDFVRYAGETAIMLA